MMSGLCLAQDLMAGKDAISLQLLAITIQLLKGIKKLPEKGNCCVQLSLEKAQQESHRKPKKRMGMSQVSSPRQHTH